MALPSRLGAFMVGAALGGAQSFYWLYNDIQNVSDAMTRKIESVRTEVAEKDRLADLKVAAIESAIGESDSESSAKSAARALSPV